MSTKYFGEYLIDKKLINEESLIEALIEQVCLQPPVSKIVYDNKYLSTEQILKILKIQQEKKIDFIQAARQIELWSDHIDTQVTNKLNEKRLPIGEILLQKKYIQVDQLSHALDEFLSNSYSPVSEEASKANKNITEVLSEDELTEINLNFSESLNQELINTIDFLQQVDILEADPGIYENMLSELYKNIQQLKGLSKLFGINPLNSLLGYIDSDLVWVMNELKTKNIEIIKNKVIKIKESIGLLGKLRNALINEKNKNAFQEEVNILLKMKENTL